MLEFWEGDKIWHEISQTFVTIKMALISVMCYIPAARKICGFAGHSAVHGCSKCLKEFQAWLLGNNVSADEFLAHCVSWHKSCHLKYNNSKLMKAKKKNGLYWSKRY